MAVNKLCWSICYIRDEIIHLIEKKLTEKQILSNKKTRALNVLIKNRNVKVCGNDEDKNLRPISADERDIINECRRQL